MRADLIHDIVSRAATVAQHAGACLGSAESLLDLAEKLAEPELRRLYCCPVGTIEERASRQVWPGAWVDATGYCRWYFGRWWHTGADLNLNSPNWDADAHSPVYAVAAGIVYAVRKFSGWGNVLCIKHADCLTRYAHVESILVCEGQQVAMGAHIASIGNAGGRYPYHLHIDVARIDARMMRYPGDWPGADKSRVLRDYLDPKLFLKAHV